MKFSDLNLLSSEQLQQIKGIEIMLDPNKVDYFDDGEPWPVKLLHKKTYTKYGTKIKFFTINGQKPVTIRDFIPAITALGFVEDSDFIVQTITTFDGKYTAISVRLAENL